MARLGRPLSLNARLALTFSGITVVCFITVGAILFNTLSDQVYGRDDTDLVLTARHMRRLASELSSPSDVREHRARLISLILGDAARTMRIIDPAGDVLIDYNPSAAKIPNLRPVDAANRITTDDVQHWQDAGGGPIHGVATQAVLQDGSVARIAVVRSESDRVELLRGYRANVVFTVAGGIVLTIILSYLLVHRALTPLARIGARARAITADRLSERIEVRAAPAELEELVGSLNTMLQRLQQGFERIWQFTTDLAHDLRTPIGNMRGASEVALTRTRTSLEYQALLASNIEECDRVSRMIENVLFLARAESPQFAIRRTQFDARRELQHIVEYFEGPSSEAGIDVRVEGFGNINAERELFRRAISNLLANAIRYTPRGAEIVLGIEVDDQATRICVTNPGEGIAAVDLERIFDRFYRADKSRATASSSAGLGLAIVKTILELHGGDVTVTSEPLGATCFCLSFPNTPGRVQRSSVETAQAH